MKSLNPEFEVVKLKPGQVLQADPKNTKQVRPIRLWVFPDGDAAGNPSYAWEMMDIEGNFYISQISHAMLMEGMSAVRDFNAGKET